MEQVRLTREDPIRGLLRADSGLGSVALPETLLDWVTLHALHAPMAPALVSAQRTLSYSELVDFLRRAGAALRRHGIGPQTRVGVLVPEGLDGVLLVLAITAHAQLVPFNPALTDTELNMEAERIGCDLMIVAPSRAETSLEGCVFAFTLDDGDLQLVLRKGQFESSAADAEHRIAFLLRSSGTTGEPKQIAVTHGNLRAMADKMAKWFALSAHERIPCMLPLYYAAGLKTSVFVPLLIGASVGVPDMENVHDLAQWFSTIRPTILSLAPASLRAVADRLNQRACMSHWDGLRFVICGAAYLPDALRREAEAALAVPVIEYYGLSEAGAMAANPAPPGLRKPGTVGLPARGELTVRDTATGRELGAGETGEIWLTGPSVTSGYVSAAQRTPQGLETGWLATGDLGCLDKNGYLTIVGRSKELINRGGEKVSPYEVEKALLRHPAVSEAGVFAIPHPRLGENVGAAIVLKGGTCLTQDEIRNFLAGELAPFKIPRRIDLLPRLPRGPTGKIIRAELARLVATRPDTPKHQPDRMLEHQIAALWAQLLRRNDLGIDDDFFEAGGDSLLAAEMLAGIEDLTQKRVPQSQLAARLTIRSLADAVCSSLLTQQELLTALRRGDGIPLFFCHGDYTTRGFFALRLLELVNVKRSIYLLHFYQDLHRPDLTIEEIAASYLPEIRKVYPCGPAIMMGYCNGGLVAWELTRQMEKAGYQINSLLLIETPSLNARPTFRVLHFVMQTLSRFLPGRAGQVMAHEGMRALWHRMRGHDTFRSLLSHAWTRLERRLARRKPSTNESAASPHWLYQRTLSRYKPGPVHTSVVCFIARDGRLMDTDETYWRRLARAVFGIELPGTHHSIVTSEAPQLAKELRRVLTLLP